MNKFKIHSLLLLILFLLIVTPAAGGQEYEVFFKQGVEAFKAKNFNSAELLFKKAIEADDTETRDRAWFYLARSIYQQKNYDSALYEFNSFLNKCKTAEVCMKSRFWMGETYYKQNKFNKAIFEFKRFISNSKDQDLNAVSSDRIATIYYRQKRYDEAVIEWEKAITSSNDKNKNAWRVYRIAEAFFQNNKYAQALTRVKPILTSRADKKVIARARIISGRIYLKQGNPRNALIILNGIPSHLLKISPYSDARYFKALCFLKLKNKRAAKSEFELFVLIGKDSQWYYDAQYELGVIYFTQKNYSKSLNILTGVIKNTPKPKVKAKSAAVVGTLYYKNKPETAIHFLEQALPIASGAEKKNILFVIGKAYLKISKYEKAGEIFNKILTDYPFHKDIDEVKFYIARVYLEKKDIDAALAMFKKIQEENPFSPYIKESNFYLGILHFQKKEYKKSELLLKKYLRSGKVENPYEAYIQLLKIYLNTGNIASAEKTARLVMGRYTKNEAHVDVLYRLVQVLKKKDKSSAYYIRYLFLYFPASEPSLSIYMERGDAYYRKKEYKKAANYYLKYLSNNGTRESGRIFFRRIQALYNLKKYTEVLAIMKKGKYPPMNESQWQQIPYLLARCNYALENFKQVYNLLYNKNINKFPDDILSVWIRSSFKMGDAASGKKAMKLLVNNKKRYAEALYFAGRYHMNRAEQDDALEIFARILTETPETKYVDYANLSFAKVYLSKNRFEEAVKKLEKIKLPSLKSEKTAYLIMCFFNLEKHLKATALTSKNINSLRKSKHGEMVFRANMQYYFEKGLLGGFKKYSNLLSKYKGNRNFINYQYAQLYMSKKAYKSAYYFFYKVTLTKNDLYPDALFNLAMLNLFVLRNRNAAIKNLQKLIKNVNSSEYLYKAKINLAIIYNESGKKEKAKKLLLDIIKSPKRKIYSIMAQNLILQFFPPVENRN